MWVFSDRNLKNLKNCRNTKTKLCRIRKESTNHYFAPIESSKSYSLYQASLPGNCWVLETDHVYGEISEHIFAPRLLFTYSALAYANYLSFHQRALKESGNVPCLYFFPKKFSIINWVDNVDWPPLGVEADRGVESGRTRGERGWEAGEEIKKALVFGLFTAYQPIKNQYPETFFDFHITSTKVWSKRFYRRENVIFFHQIRLRDRSWIILLVPRGL